ncbi:MAG: hypothetical protein HRU77_04245 [Gammaproteobacteria bacterium]|jgi:hypothetical protein|nr:MAG: hypothetical protein HRU77_04245 [Gammaproteobacteria bacterium]
MKCIAKDLPPADPNLDPAELRREFDKIASENMQSVERLMASKGFVQLRHNPIPVDGSEEGMPIKWGNKSHAIPILPDRDDRPSEIG